MTSIVQIANLAFSKLGRGRIMAITEECKEARAFNTHYESVRDAELGAHNWGFAIKRDMIPASSTPPSWGYDFAYPLPADSLRLIEINDIYAGVSLSNYVTSTEQDWTIENREILTNAAFVGGSTLPTFSPPSLKIRYVFRQEDVTAFDPTFVEALACRLAMEMCEELTQSNTKVQIAQAMYKKAMSDAIKSNAVQLPPTQIPDSAWILSRL